MTTTPLPSYGIWTTDMEGKRVMGFTPEQFMNVWQARADMEAENQRLREALQLFNVYVTAMENDDHVAGMLAYGQFEDAARAALESKP